MEKTKEIAMSQRTGEEIKDPNSQEFQGPRKRAS